MIFYLVIAILLVIGIAVLFGSHYFVYFSIIHFFGVIDPASSKFILAIFAFLAVSFILSSALAHFRENIFTRSYYFISSLWLGILANLVLASAVAWAIIGITSLLGLNSDYFVLGIFFFSLAVGYSVYGVWNALHPRIKNITVTIPGLPAQWKNKKIVQLSDVHIGHVHKDAFMRYVVDKINLVNPEMVVITGDLFDGMDGDLDQPLKALNDIRADKGIFFVTGNHETFLGEKFVHTALNKTKVKMMKDEVIDIDGLKLIGINYPDHGETRDAVMIIENMKKDFLEKPNILLYHSPVNIKKFSEVGVNLQLSGHTHDAQIFPLGYVAKLIFKGYNYGLYPMGNYTLYVTNGTGTWGPPMRTGNIPEIVAITLQ